jgi:hypothetical protein
LVHEITGVLLRHHCNVTSNHEFVDAEAGQFFMRTEFAGEAKPSAILEETQALLPGGGSARLAPQCNRRVVVFASREHHCLADLLVRHAFNEINAEVLAVISNHDTLRPLVEKFGVPFHHVSHDGRIREEHEAAVIQLLDSLQPECPSRIPSQPPEIRGIPTWRGHLGVELPCGLLVVAARRPIAVIRNCRFRRRPSPRVLPAAFTFLPLRALIEP